MPNLKVRGNKRTIQLLATERRQLQSALEPLAGLSSCGDKNAEEIHGRLVMLLKDVSRDDYGTFTSETED